jgi:hypothetical protein
MLRINRQKETRKKLQWFQNPSSINWDNLNNIRREACRHFRKNKEKRVYLKDKLNERATHSKNKNIRNMYRGHAVA